jgi:hypothetical protein
METSITDIHSLTGVYQRSILNSASGIIILLVYDRGGYSHPLHPIDRSIAPPHIINASQNLLEVFSQSVQIIRRNVNRKDSKDELSYAVFFRLDRMEEKNYQELDTLYRLKLTPEDLPVVLMLKGRSLLDDPDILSVLIFPLSLLIQMEPPSSGFPTSSPPNSCLILSNWQRRSLQQCCELKDFTARVQLCNSFAKRRSSISTK